MFVERGTVTLQFLAQHAIRRAENEGEMPMCTFTSDGNKPLLQDPAPTKKGQTILEKDTGTRHRPLPASELPDADKFRVDL